MELTEFQYVHEYMAMVNRGEAAPILCTCGAKFIARNEDDTLVFWCPPDDYVMEPGQKLLHQIHSTVDRRLKV